MLQQLGILILACWLIALLLFAVGAALCGCWGISLMSSTSIWLTFQMIDDAQDDALDTEDNQ